MLPVIGLCEGEEDVSFLSALIAQREIGSFDFHEPNGTGAFTRTLVGLKTGTEIRDRKAVLIVSDNDGKPKEHFAAIQAQIKESGWNSPQHPRQGIEQPDMPPLHVLMLPWDDEEGCLETACLIAAGNRHPKEMECVKKFIACIDPEGWSVPMMAKLSIRCFLSAVCKSAPNTGIRHAWRSERKELPIPIDDPCFDKIANYLAGLV
jgi:hypothetical protein